MLLLKVPTLMTILKCDVIVEESQKIIFLVSRSTLETVDCQEHEDLDRFFNILTTNLPNFSAARFFSINRSTILSMCGTVTSFLIVLLTFNPTQNNCIVKTNISET
jgi:gustatory receptor